MKKDFPRWYGNPQCLNATLSDANDFSSLFWKEVSAIRQKFWLKPAGLGLDLPRGAGKNWQPYLINDPELGSSQVLAFIAVEEFRWNILKKSVTNSKLPYPLMNFNLALHFAVPSESKAVQHGLAQLNTRQGLKLPSGLVYTHHKKVGIEFRANHPLAAPLLYATGRPNGAGEHSHHWFANGMLCISPPEGSHKSWEVKNRSVVAWLNLAIAWCVWHYQKFGY